MNTTIISKRYWSSYIAPFLLLMMPIMLILLNGCSGGLKLTSDWQQSEMNMDGTDAEWQGGLYYDDASDMVYGVRNDDKYVYLFLKTQNRSTQMQIMRQGLTVWFDREDEKNQTFGIKYPMSRQETHAGFSPDLVKKTFIRFLANYFRQEIEVTAGDATQAVKEMGWLAQPIPGSEAAGQVNGSPVVAGSFFYGLEDPHAQLGCRLHRDAPLSRGERQSFVLGVAPPGQMRRAFLYYRRGSAPIPTALFSTTIRGTTSHGSRSP